MPSSDLTWTEANSPVNRIDDYRVYKSTNVLTSDPLFNDSFVLIATLPVVQDPEFPFGETHPLEFSDTAVDFVNDFYCYRVDAFSVLVGEATGGSPQTGVGPSNIICIGEPSQPATLTGNKIDDNQLDLSWVNGAAGILPAFSTCIFRSVNSGAFALLAEVFEPTVTFSDTTVENDINVYEYFVTTKDEVGIESDPSNTVEFALFVPALVAVSESGTAGERVAVSFDAGRTWEIHAGSAGNLWDGVTFSESQQLLVAVSRDGTDRVMTSPDGVIWTARSAAAALQWRDVAYSDTLDLFVAVADSGTGNRAMSSVDGINWISRTTPADLAWEVVRWVPFLSLFVAGANTGSTTDTVMTSVDGINWVQQTVASGSVNSMAFSAARVAMRCLSNFFGLTSDDGTTWNTTGVENSGVRAMAFAASIFVCVGPNSATRQNSSDGIAWANVAMPNLGYLSIVSTDDTDEFVALGSTANSVTSDDGISWLEHVGVLPSLTWGAITNALLPTAFVEQEMVMVEVQSVSPVAGLSFNASDWQTNLTGFLFRLDDVAWSSPLGLYAAVGDGACATTPDGITWTARTVPVAFDWQAVYWSDGLDLFIAGADESGTGSIMTSGNGTDWVQRTTDNGWRCHDLVEHPTANSGSPRICAVGLHGFTNPTGNMQFSDDGITWVASTTNPANRVVACTYDSTLDRVVVVETGGQCNVSSDCDTYTLNINSADIGSGNAGNSSAIDYSAELDQLVFVSGNGIFSSEDGGASFTLRNINDMQDVKWSSVLNQWIVCNDALPRVMTSPNGIDWTERFVAAEVWVAIALGDEI